MRGIVGAARKVRRRERARARVVMVAGGASRVARVRAAVLETTNDRRTREKCGGHLCQAAAEEEATGHLQRLRRRRTMSMRPKAERLTPGFKKRCCFCFPLFVVCTRVFFLPLASSRARSRHTLPTAVRACPSPPPGHSPNVCRLCVRALEGQRLSPLPPSRNTFKQQAQSCRPALSAFSVCYFGLKSPSLPRLTVEPILPLCLVVCAPARRSLLAFRARPFLLRTLRLPSPPSGTFPSVAE
jgi:hypothetical protein